MKGEMTGNHHHNFQFQNAPPPVPPQTKKDKSPIDTMCKTKKAKGKLEVRYTSE